MGVPTYNIASSISLIMAQRLVRRLCDHCKQPTTIPKEALIKEGFSEPDSKNLTLYAPSSCDHCNHGYKGRIAIFEVLPVSNDLSRLLLSGATVPDIADYAKQKGFLNLRESGLDKVKQGLTSLTEINRVI